MASLNSVHLIGRLGKDPEYRTTQGGNGICNMVLATDESYTDKSGQRQQVTEWHRIVAFAKTADLCANYLHKGSQAYVEGSLQTRKWTDQQGQERFTTEIRANRVLFLDPKGDGSNGNNSAPAAQAQQRPAPMRQAWGGPDECLF